MAAVLDRTAELDRQAMIDGLATAVGLLPEAMALGRSLAGEVDRVCFVAAGSANRAMLGLQYWIERDSPGLEVRRYFPAELMAQSPDFFGPRTLVLLASKSGSTQETVAAAEWLRAKPCRTIAFTQRADKPLAGLAQRRFIIGETAESFTGLFMAMQAVIGGLLAARDNWKLADRLLPSLAALPGAIADAAGASDARGAADAAALKDQSILYHVASGPGFTTAYVFGVCIVMEMLRLHSTALEAAEFFHGPFEVVDENTRLILILGEDPSRPLMERVARFCAKYTPHVMVYDSRDYAMPGVDPALRAIVAPYVLQSALKRISANLSILLDRKLTERRYMWKTEYEMPVMSAGPRLLGLGDNTMDSYVDAGLQFPGGNAVNVAVLAHRLGVDAGYLGCLGTDAAGLLIRQALAAEGIDLTRCRQVEGVNARARIIHNEGDRKFIGSIPGVRGRYDLAAEDFVYIAGFDAVHTSVFSELDAELPRIRAASRQVSYDFSERWNDALFARVLPHIHIAFLSAPSRDDAAVEAVLRHCAAAGVMAVATRGAAGSMALVSGEVLRQGIAPATVVDTLGAGDGFIAAFLVALLRGAEPAGALELAAGFAATVCGWQGAFGHGAAWQDSSAT